MKIDRGNLPGRLEKTLELNKNQKREIKPDACMYVSCLHEQ